MKILVIGAGNMGAWFVESFCLEHDVAVFDTDRRKLRYFFNAHRFVTFEQIGAFLPEMVINAVSLQHTVSAFNDLLAYLPEECILSDITSVKNGLQDYYAHLGRRFVSTHPMFGPTFASLKELSRQNAVIISESDEEGKRFFRDFYASLHLNIYEYSFEQHDQTMAYALSVPFASTMVFAACMKHQEAPGTTFKKHLDIARGLLSEDDYLLSEVLLNPHTLPQMEKIQDRLSALLEMIRGRDTKALHHFLQELRNNLIDHRTRE
ncbi:MAG: prephenate dehydrogenase/arogenate dehydrogenase family protein [Bacteroidales bacterium]|jgi:prephenate dehydrogenase|nr:prephenate dehydrogenase/arogenate dehydrogenase family protein [Bacteroidales bacterium]